MKKVRSLYWVTMGTFILIFVVTPMAQEYHPDVDINVISREIEPNVNINEISKQIATHPAYERATKIAKEIEGDLNRRVQKMVEEKQGTINALKRQILEEAIGPKPPEDKEAASLFDEKTRIFIFVSRSVPLEILKSYAADIKTLGNSNVRFVFRAFPKNFLDSMLRKSPDCTHEDCVVKAKVTIGSKLFKRYAIHQVPAVVYDPNPTDKTHTNWIKVSGAAPLEKILTLFYRDVGKETFKIAAQRVAKK